MTTRNTHSRVKLGIALTTALLFNAGCGNGTEFAGKAVVNAKKQGNLPDDAARNKANKSTENQANRPKTGSEELPTDATPPVVSDITIEVPNDTLGPEANVRVGWKATDNVGVAKIQLEIRPIGKGTWEVVKELPGDASSHTFQWLDRPLGSFEVRITAFDAAGNAGELSSKWLPQVFNAAILTRSVDCFFCHIHIEGDVGGIEFPRTLHDGSGTGVKISGNLYATNAAPAELKSRIVPGASIFENYMNQEAKIFPRDLKFPTVTLDDLRPRMSGHLTYQPVNNQGRAKGERTTAKKVIEGNLILDGTKEPFQLSGEVLITGDLVIKGKYKGVGTIYANNVFVIGDVVAVDSVFPYPIEPKAALEKARADVGASRDALYLGALNQALIGSLKTTMHHDTRLKIEKFHKPTAWLSDAEFAALGQKPLAVSAFLPKDPAKKPTWPLRAWNYGTPENPASPGTLPVLGGRDIDVNRVDAYVYGGYSFLWPAYANFVLNGGFMSERASLVSSLQRDTGSFWCGGMMDGIDKIPDCGGTKFGEWLNPRNGLPTHTNVVRFDYRLKVGSPGFDSLKRFFNQ